MSDRNAEARIVDGTVWRDFCRALEKAGDTILRASTPADPFDRAEGYPLPDAPAARRPREPDRVLRSVCYPALLSSSRTRRSRSATTTPTTSITTATSRAATTIGSRGTRGTVPYLSFGTKAGSYERDAEMWPTGQIDSRDMQIEPDGSFEILVSQDAEARQLAPDEGRRPEIIVRQTFDDARRRDRPPTTSNA